MAHSPNRIRLSSVGLCLLIALAFGLGAEAEVRVNDITAREQSFPSVAADARGIYVVWQGAGGLQRDIRFARSDGPGEAFEPSKVLNDDATGADQFGAHIAVAPEGPLYVVWADYRSRTDYDIYMTRSDDGGKSFSANVRVNAETGGTQIESRVAVADGENPVVVWNDNRDSTHEDYGIKWRIMASMSEDRGGVFTEAVRADDSPEDFALWPDLACDGSGAVFVTWYERSNQIRFARSADGGRSFEGHCKVSDYTAFMARPRIAAAGGGRVRIVWMDGRNSAAGRDPLIVIEQKYTTLDVYAADSLDGGATFTGNFMVNRQILMNQMRPDAATDGDLWAVAWADDRSVGDFTVRVFAEDASGGVLLEDRRADAHPAFTQSTHPAVAVFGGTVFVAWQDFRSGDFDIYLASIPAEPEGGSR